MMLLGSIFIPANQWVWPSGAILAAAFLLLIWSYRRAPAISAAHGIAVCLKLLGVLALVLCLTEPLWSGKRAKSGANLFVVIADNSSGMNVRDRGMTQSRGQILQAALKVDQADWLGTLANNFQLRQYVFDSRLRRATDFSELVFDGKASTIGATLRTVAERYRGRPLAGVLLMTDGNATDMTEQSYDLSDAPPVYPVVIGSADPQKDISLVNVSVSQTSFEDAPVMVQADVEASGYAGKTVEVSLVENSGNVAEQQTWKISRSDEKEAFRFRLRPDRTGVLFYHLEVAETSKAEPAEES
ncbi:MAG: glutamine amidotransferase, partial [Planctomycetota bacterium]